MILNKNTMPARCVLNGLVTEPVPDELKSLDALSKQLIQRAKAFQTIVRLGTYSGKVPAFNGGADPGGGGGGGGVYMVASPPPPPPKNNIVVYLTA